MRLLDEYPLLVFPSLATALGLNESIVLQQVHYWLEINKKSAKQDKFIDGRWWAYNSYSGWNENFPFWSDKTIRRTVFNLETIGVLLSANHNSDKRDRTKWYSIDYERLDEICENKKNASGQVDPNASGQVDPNATGQVDQFLNIQRIHTENTYREEDKERARKKTTHEALDCEILEEPEPIENRSSSLAIHTPIVARSENKTVPAAARGKKAIESDHLAQLCAAWNEHKATLWASIRIPPNPARCKALLKFSESCGSIEKAIEYLVGALKYMREDEYWASAKLLTIENILSNNKIHQHYEKYMELQENPAIVAVAEKLKQMQEPKSFHEIQRGKDKRAGEQAVVNRMNRHPEEFEPEELAEYRAKYPAQFETVSTLNVEFQSF